MITFKNFKELCNDQTYTGWNGHKIRINAFFFDYMSGDNFRGYKYMVSANVKDCNKTELLKEFYAWVINEKNIPWYINYKFAKTDEDRFKISLSI